MRGRQPACTHPCTYSTWKCAPAQHIGPFRVHVRDLGHTTTAGVGKLHFCARRTHQLNKLRAHSCMCFIYIYIQRVGYMRLQVGVHGPVPLHTLNCTAETHRCSQNSSADSRCAARSFIGAVSPLIIFHARRFKLFKIARFGGPSLLYDVKKTQL